MNNRNVYSMYSGLYYTVPEDHFAMLDGGQVPLKKGPQSCKTCHSRGYIGFDSKNYIYSVCKCVGKNTDKDMIRSKFNIQLNSV